MVHIQKWKFFLKFISTFTAAIQLKSHRNMTMPSSGIESYKASTDRCPEATDNHYLPLRVSLEDLLAKKLLKAVLASLGFLASFTDIL